MTFLREISTVVSLSDNDLISFVNSEKSKDFFYNVLKWREGYVYSRQSFEYCIITLRRVLKRKLEIEGGKLI